jgi:CRISPR-associated protein Csd1
MILEKLVQHYDTLARSDSSIVAPIGYSSAKVSHEIVLSEDGSIRNINDLRHASEKRLVPLEIIVPLQEKRTAGKKAYFLCDKSKYVFGLELNKSGNKKSADDHESEDVKLDPYPE